MLGSQTGNVALQQDWHGTGTAKPKGVCTASQVSRVVMNWRPHTAGWSFPSLILLEMPPRTKHRQRDGVGYPRLGDLMRACLMRFAGSITGQ